MSDLSILDRSLGCLFGGAMGDAFGHCISHISREMVLFKYGPGGLQEPLLSNGKYYISDSTQMSLLTADGFLTNYTQEHLRGASEPLADSIYRKYRGWAKAQGFGLMTDGQVADSWLLSDPSMTAKRSHDKACIDHLREYSERGLPDKPHNDCINCSGLKRVAPLGLIAYAHGHPVETAMEWGEEVAASTNGDPLGWIPAACLTSIIYHLCEGKDVKASVKMAIFDCIIRYEENKHMKRMIELLDLAEDLIKLKLSDEGGTAVLLGMGSAAGALAAAVFACLRHAHDPMGCLRCAINVDHEPDSVGSVAGNILGTYLGIAEIEKAFDISKLECHDKIQVMAEDIVCKSPIWDYGPSYDLWVTKYIEFKDPYKSAYLL